MSRIGFSNNAAEGCARVRQRFPSRQLDTRICWIEEKSRAKTSSVGFTISSAVLITSRIRPLQPFCRGTRLDVFKRSAFKLETAEKVAVLRIAWY